MPGTVSFVTLPCAVAGIAAIASMSKREITVFICASIETSILCGVPAASQCMMTLHDACPVGDGFCIRSRIANLSDRLDTQVRPRIRQYNTCHEYCAGCVYGGPGHWN